MEKLALLRAISDETRMNILTLLLKHNCCVRALARSLGFTEATISQHLKVLREAGLLIGEKRGYFMHYDVERSVLHELAKEIELLAAIEREACTPESGGCAPSEQANCHVKKALANCHEKKECSDEVKEFCHGKNDSARSAHHGHCKCRKS